MLELSGIYKSYEGKPLLCGVSFQVAAGETVCLLGPSGSGKSTLLRIIAGLEAQEKGQVRWQGQDLAGVPTHLRGFGLVFQDYALFPHMNVAENVAFGLKMQNLPREEREKRVAQMLAMVNLAEFGLRRVGDLSGGEQQRVALARALAPQPRLLMFDEPLGALDQSLRQQLQDELRRILRASGVPAIYVSHDQEEAFNLADRLLLLHEGIIQRSGSPAEVWNHPGSAWAAKFLDAGNVLEGEILSDRQPYQVQTPAGRLEMQCAHAHAAGERVSVLIGRSGFHPQADGNLGGRVVDVLFKQAGFRVRLDNGLEFMLDSAPDLGERLELTVPLVEVQCLA